MKIFFLLLVITLITTNNITSAYILSNPTPQKSGCWGSIWGYSEMIFLGTGVGLCISFVRDVLRMERYIYAEVGYISFTSEREELPPLPPPAPQPQPMEEIVMRAELNESLSFSSFSSAGQYTFTSMELLVNGNNINNLTESKCASNPFSCLRILGDHNTTRNLSSFSDVFLKEEFVDGTFLSSWNVPGSSFVASYIKREQWEFWLSHVEEDLMIGFLLLLIIV